MTHILKSWYIRNFTHPDAIRLMVIIFISFITIFFFGDLLTPIAVSIIIAYLLDGLIEKLRKLKLPILLATIIVLCVSISLLLVTVLLLIPVLWEQLANLIQDLPNIITTGHSFVKNFIDQHPEILSSQFVDGLFSNFKDELTSLGQFIVTLSLSSIPNLIMLVIYVVMIPLLVFFFLLDKKLMLSGITNLLDKNSLLLEIGNEINIKLGNYVRGKVIEMTIVAVVSCSVFMIIGLDYALLLGCLVGLSAFIPFVGGIFVTIPIIIIGLLQWGWDGHFIWLCITYSIILFLDANILVPFLFSGAMKMHPLTIIIAIFIFGGLWGFWGVFFAIPLAVVIKSIIFMWPQFAKV